MLVIAFSLVVVLLAMPVAFVLHAFGAPRSVVRRVLAAGVVVGGVLLVVGLSMAGLWWLLAVVAVELAGIAP